MHSRCRFKPDGVCRVLRAASQVGPEKQPAGERIASGANANRVFGQHRRGARATSSSQWLPSSSVLFGSTFAKGLLRWVFGATRCVTVHIGSGSQARHLLADVQRAGPDGRC